MGFVGYAASEVSAPSVWLLMFVSAAGWAISCRDGSYTRWRVVEMGFV